MVGQFHFKAQWGCFSQWHGAVEISTYYYYCCHYLHHLASIRGCWRCHHWHFGIRSIPVLPQQHVKDTGHSDKSAGGRLQLNTHAPNVCGFAWSDMTWCMVVWCLHRPRRDGSSFTWHQPYNIWTAIHQLAIHQKTTVAHLESHVTNAQWICPSKSVSQSVSQSVSK